MLHAHCQCGCLGGNKGVAVSIASDPGAELEHRWSRDIGIGTVYPPYRLFQVAIDLGYGVEQAFAEIEHAVLDLIANFRFLRTHFVGLPQDLDLGTQQIGELLALLFAKTGIVEPLAGDKDPAQILHHGAALGLRRMGGKYRHIGEFVQHRLDLFKASSLFVKLSQDRVEGAGPERSATAHLQPALAMLVGLFGNINKAEIEAVRTDNVDQCLCIQALYESGQLSAFGTIFFFTQADITLAESFYGLQYAAASLIVEYFAQQIAEQFYPRTECFIADNRHNVVVTLSCFTGCPPGKYIPS